LPPTPPETLRKARDIARAEGVRYVYTGNVVDPDGEQTHCHACGESLVERAWFAVKKNALVGTNRCPKCQAVIPGVFDARAKASSPGARHSLL
jgi:pyruvate formate lyase activating enzyme